MSLPHRRTRVAVSIFIAVVVATAAAQVGGVASRSVPAVTCGSSFDATVASKTTSRGTTTLYKHDTKRRLCAVFNKDEDAGTATKLSIKLDTYDHAASDTASGTVPNAIGPVRIRMPQFAESACAVMVTVKTPSGRDRLKVGCLDFE